MLNSCLRCSALFVGVFTLVQGLVWAGFSIWGIAIYSCAAKFPFDTTAGDNFHSIPIAYLYYVTYLRGECANKEFLYVAPSASKSYNYMMAYSIISSIWVPTSVMLVVGTCIGARGGKAKCIYIPWIIVTAATLILDISSTINYSFDISKTMTAENYIVFMDFPTAEIRQRLGLEFTDGLAGWSVVPAIIMTLLGSRAVILWVLNLFFILFGLQGICAFSKNNPPEPPVPYVKSTQFLEDSKSNNGGLQGDQFFEFSKPDSTRSRNRNPNDPHFGGGTANIGFVIDEPLRLDPVQVEVKQERPNLRYAEVESIEMDDEPEDIHSVRTVEKIQGPLGSQISVPISEAESALEEEGDVLKGESVPAENGETRKVYDVYGNPTEERLTPKITRIQKIIQDQLKANQSRSDLSGVNNNRPFSYTQPLQPQVDMVHKKNDTVRGLDKPPIPVPDYSVRVAKKTSFRTPLPTTD